MSLAVGRGWYIPFLQISYTLDSSLCIRYHFDKEVGKGSSTELVGLATVEIAVIDGSLPGRISQTRCRRTSGRLLDNPSGKARWRGSVHAGTKLNGLRMH